MSDETPDGGLKAGAAAPVESSPLPAQAKQSSGGTRPAPPKSPRKGGRSGPQRGLVNLERTQSAKDNSIDKRSGRKESEEDASGHSEFWSDYKKGATTKPSSKYVNDSRLLAMANLELMRAQLRANFFSAYAVLDEMSVNRQAGCAIDGKTSIAMKWRSEGRIVGLPFVDVVVYPAFQFQPDGQPYPLLLEVNKALPEDCTDWHRASWLVSPNEWLEGETPVPAIQRGDPEVAIAASHAYEVPIG